MPGRAVLSLPSLEKTTGWEPIGQLDLLSSQLTCSASDLALLFFPSRDTQYRNSLSASSTLPRVAKACAFLKCAWKKTLAFNPILIHLLIYSPIMQATVSKPVLNKTETQKSDLSKVTQLVNSGIRV